jgi:glycosyltransferase involved in cell wall biosynthesis
MTEVASDRQTRYEPNMSPPYTIGVPWGAPVFADYNGQHPLPRSLIVDTPEFTFSTALQERTAATRSAVERAAAALRDAVRPAGLRAQDVDAFIASRAPDSQEMMSAPMDLLFLHTAPLTLGQRPWALHIESTSPMFEPFWGHFRTQHLDLDTDPTWHLVRSLVGAPECRGILTHVKRTADDLPVLFRNPTLAQKIHYAPLGLDMPAHMWAAAAAAVAAKDAKRPEDEVVFLFTNSWHQDPDSFIKRGGLEVIVGFLILLMRRPNVRLILRTALTDQLDPALREHVRTHPRIEVYEDAVSDAALYDMLFRADVFLVPSTHLHTISILRAMATGAVVVTTDAVAIDEFVAHGETGFVLPAWKNVMYWEDRERALVREAEASTRQTNGTLAANLLMTMEHLVVNPDLRVQVRGKARRQVMERHRLEPWRAGFHAMLRAALAG